MGRSPVAFTMPEAARLAGLKYATLRYWQRTGFLTPTRPADVGWGRSVYAFRDVAAAKAAAQLRDQGVSLQALRKAVAVVKQLFAAAQPLAEVRLVVRGDDVIAQDEHSAISTLRKPGQREIPELELAPLVDQLRAAVAQLRAAQAAEQADRRRKRRQAV